MNGDGLSLTKYSTMQKQPSEWVDYPLSQFPHYPDNQKLQDVMRDLQERPPLVTFEEIYSLKEHLTRIQGGNGFLLQVGECAETFTNNKRPYLEKMLNVFHQMESSVKATAAEVLTMGRLAGQYGKSRSKMYDQERGVASYFGDIVNDVNVNQRTPQPERMLQAYDHILFCLNFLRQTKEFAQTLFTSHESYLLPFEEALCRKDGKEWLATSAHFLWVGDRMRQKDGAHVFFASIIANPIGVKIGPLVDPSELKKLVEKLNPYNQKGRLILIWRLGKKHIQEMLPFLLKEIKSVFVLHMCDPLHGNTYQTKSSLKTRNFQDCVDELTLFFKIVKEQGSIPQGLHCEISPLFVEECVDEKRQIFEDNLGKHYTTICDPRLSPEQAVEISKIFAELIK